MYNAIWEYLRSKGEKLKRYVFAWEIPEYEEVGLSLPGNKYRFQLNIYKKVETVERKASAMPFKTDKDLNNKNEIF